MRAILLGIFSYFQLYYIDRRCELKWELVHKIACERDCELSSHFSRCNELNDERVHIFVGERERELVQILREL